MTREFDQRILPDKNLWGPGYGGPYTPAELDEIARIIAAKPPARHSNCKSPKLFGRIGEYSENSSRLWLPPGHDAARKIVGPNDGNVFNDPVIKTSYLDPDQLPNQLQEFFKLRGWQLDQHGRPCHPHLAQLLGDNRIGLNTGLGHNPFYGERVTVNAVVYNGTSLLLNERRHAGETTYSLPTGRIIASDNQISTESWNGGSRPVSYEGILWGVRRIIYRKAGLTVSPYVTPALINANRIPTFTDTANSWTVTYNFRVALAAEADRTLYQRCNSVWLDLNELKQSQIPLNQWLVIQATKTK